MKDSEFKKMICFHEGQVWSKEGSKEQISIVECDHENNIITVKHIGSLSSREFNGDVVRQYIVDENLTCNPKVYS